MDEQLLARLETIDSRIKSLEIAISTLNREVGALATRIGNSGTIPVLAPLLIKFVIFPLIVIIGGLVGVKVFLP